MSLHGSSRLPPTIRTFRYAPCLTCTNELGSPWKWQNPGEIKRREVSWTLRKKLAQKRSRAGRWCWARESWTSFDSVVSQWWSYGHCLCDCSAQQLGQQMCRAVVDPKCRTDAALTFCCSGGGPQQPWSSRLAPVSRSHSSRAPFPHSSPSLTGLLASVDIKQQKLTNNRNERYYHYYIIQTLTTGPDQSLFISFS